MAANQRGAVVVTGASTGIGRTTALHLDRLGFDVLAGVRRPGDGESVQAEASERLRPVILDVTDAESIAAAAREAGEATGGRLAGLVNNAGVALAGPLEILPIDELRRQLEINVVGLVATTQAMLPLIRTGGGRVVNMGSVGGRVAVPGVGAYAASKFAVEGLSDSLRRELRPWGIWVAVVEPGAVRTPIWDKGEDEADRLLASIPPQQLDLYQEAIEATRVAARVTGASGIPPERVAKAVEHALTARRPRARYMLDAETKSRVLAQRLLPVRVFDGLMERALRRRANG